jgi:hypothetical protein
MNKTMIFTFVLCEYKALLEGVSEARKGLTAYVVKWSEVKWSKAK